MTTPTKPCTGQRVSVAEFLELDLPEPDDKRKMELDDGVLYIMPRPRPRHQSVQGTLYYHFEPTSAASTSRREKRTWTSTWHCHRSCRGFSLPTCPSY